MVVAASFCVPYAIYWMPVWFGAADDQYSSWAPLFIGICFAAGTITGGAGLVLMRWAGQRAKINAKKHTSDASEPT